MRRIFLTMNFVCFVTIVIFSQNWKDRKNWPENFPKPPKTEKRLFFLQRNVNSNTIAYDLNVNSDGTLDVKDPIDVYWMRYTGNRNGVREEITWFQRNFAFGYSTYSSGRNDEVSIKLVAYKDRKVNLKKINGNWSATMEINGKNCQLSNIYVYADESGMMPEVEHVDIFGKDLTTGETVYERILAD